MSETRIVVLALLIAWTGYQVAALRNEERQRHLQRIDARRRSELDDELRRLCPTICSSFTIEDLREWQSVHLRKHKYYQDRKDLALQDPISDEPSDWSSIYWMYLHPKTSGEPNYPFPKVANDEERGYLTAAREVTEAFVKSAGVETALKP